MIDSAARPQRCPTCGARNRAQVTWCIECGEPLDGSVGASGGAGRAAPDGDRATRRRLRWEFGVGVVLALVVLLAGGIDWLVQEHGAQAYSLGAAAAARRHWSEALAAYQAAGPYRDAPQRAAEAATTLQRITSAYDQATRAAAAQDWRTAAAAYATVADLQPDYAAVAERLPLARIARTQQGAAGVIYQAGDPARGLFIIGPPGVPPQRLPGSDARSRVRLFAAPGRYVVYDGPGTPPPPATSDPDAGRVLWLADLGDPAAPQGAPLPLTFTIDGQGLAAAAGFWWLSPRLTDPMPDDYYYEYATHEVTPLPRRAGWDVAAADPAQGRLLLRHRAGDQTWLDLADARSDLLDLAVQIAGTIQDAQISPDGRVVVFTNVLPQGSTISRRLMLWQLVEDGAASPPGAPRPGSPPPGAWPRLVVLDTLVVPGDAPLSGGRLTARFLPGAGPLRLLSDHTDPAGRRQTMLNLDTGLQYTYWVSLPAPFLLETFSLSPGGQLVLTQHFDPSGLRLVLQPTDHLDVQHPLLVPNSPNGWAVTLLAPADDYLVYAATAEPRGRTRQAYTLYTTPLAAGGAPGVPRQLYRGLYDARTVLAPFPTLAPHGQTLLYLTAEGLLHVAALDGQFDDPFLADVRRLWAPSQ